MWSRSVVKIGEFEIFHLVEPEISSILIALAKRDCNESGDFDVAASGHDRRPDVWFTQADDCITLLAVAEIVPSLLFNPGCQPG